MTSKKNRPSIIIAYWDTSDPNNEGWAYRAIYVDDEGQVRSEWEESGEVQGRASLSEQTLMRRARAAAGYPGTRIPVEVR